MPRSSALPFFIRRSEDVVSATEVTSTKERTHGLLRLEGGRLFIQWRVARTTDRVGVQIRTDREMDPVQEAVVPLNALAGARVRWRGLVGWLLGPQIVLTAADLRSFESVTGTTGLRLNHPAELALRIRRSDLLPAQEFASDLNLALADLALRSAEEHERQLGRTKDEG